MSTDFSILHDYLHEYLETGGVSGKFEKTHDTNNGEKFENVRILKMGRKLLKDEVNIKGEGGHVVNDIDGGPDKITFVRTGDEADEDFKAEPRITNTFDVEKGFVGIRPRLVQRPSSHILTRVHRDIPYHRHSHVRMSLEAE